MLRRVILSFFLWINFFFVFPCGWDADTIAMEKQTFPTIHELITGKFLQHSKEFYYWRVKDREEKIKLFPDSLDLYDDLAWAYNKIDEPEKGVEVMLEKEKIQPGLYKTYANLGTCYIHSKQFETGLEFIKKAIEINPEAHFGREVYQQYLVEYVLSKKDSSGHFTTPLGFENNNFYHFVKKKHFKGAKGAELKKEISKAIKGVAGMMKFSNHNSPILLEALGDLLNNAQSGVDLGAGHLASRAYLKASFLSKNDEAIKGYQVKANKARERQFSGPPSYVTKEEDGNTVWNRPRPPHFAHHAIKLEDLEKVLKLEIQAANLWVGEIKQNELNWIKDGINPDSAFSVTYYEEPSSEVVSKNKARKNIGEIEEEYWLNLQLENPEDISSIHLLNELPDSTKKWMDSIYKVEFSVLPDEPVKVMDSVDTENKLDKPVAAEQAPESNSYLLYIAIALVVLLVLVLAWKAGKKK